ncbi:MAG: response regulator transcription factor [Phaeodactylibacter sp.]|nr:response regulator transcription factor [Phaeodactylibacter sp.]
MIKVLIADDHKITTDGILAFLEKEPGIEVAGIVHNGRDAIGILEKQPVDVAVLDIRMPVMDGIETTRAIASQYPRTKVVILSMFKKKAFVKGVLDAGAMGYVLKDNSKEALVYAIHAVSKGARIIPPEILDIYFSGPPEEEEEEISLTERELEILCLMVEGLTAREIGEALNIAKVTAETHIRNAKSKLGISRKAQLVRWAVDKGVCG